MSKEDIDRAKSITKVMESLPEHKQEILLAFGEGMAAMADWQRKQEERQIVAAPDSA